MTNIFVTHQWVSPLPYPTLKRQVAPMPPGVGYASG